MLASLSQLFKFHEIHTILSPAGAAQDVTCRFVFVLVECNFEARGVMVQMGGATGPGEPFRETLFNHFRRNAGRLTFASIAERRKEELHVVWDGVSQQIQDVRDSSFVELKTIATTQALQKFNSSWSIPRVQAERGEVVDRA